MLPAVGEVDAIALRHWLLRQAGGDGRARKVLRRVTTDQADVRGVRPYRPGDPIRGIHWRSSARRGELMVREYDAAPSPELVLVLEPWLPKEPAATERANLEAALSLAATVALALESGIRHASDDRHRRRPRFRPRRPGRPTPRCGKHWLPWPMSRGASRSMSWDRTRLTARFSERPGWSSAAAATHPTPPRSLVRRDGTFLAVSPLRPSDLVRAPRDSPRRRVT